MARGLKQKLKLYYLKNIMLEKTDSEHAITITKMQEELGKVGVTAERKSLYNDLADLHYLGVDVEGRPNGKSHVYNVVKRDFELAELKLLVDAIQSSKFITERKSRELIKKLEAFCSEYEAKQLQRQVYVQGRIKTKNETIYDSVDAIHIAISENKQIKFKYSKWNAKAQLEFKKNGEFYEISPWALTWDDENYYLVAYDSAEDKIKHYRVDKMTSVSVTDKAREGKANFKDFDLASYARNNFGMYGGVEERVTVTVDSDKVGIFIDRFGKENISIMKVDDFHVNVRFSAAISGQFYGWIFGLGDCVKIVSPESVVNDAKTYMKNVMKMYK